MTADVLKTLHLKAPQSVVWRALTEPEQLAQWFPDRTDLQPVPGAEGVFDWEKHGKFAVRLEEIVPESRLVWSWARKPDIPLNAGHRTRVEWSLEPSAEGGTILNLRESGFQNEKGRAENDGGWDQELGELVTHLATLTARSA